MSKAYEMVIGLETHVELRTKSKVFCACKNAFGAEPNTHVCPRKARRIYLAATFGLFTNGMAKFDKAYEDGLFDKVLTTNLVYQTPELLSRDYYVSVDMSKYIALLIDTLNHDASISHLLNPTERINKVVNAYKKEHNQE